MVCVVCCVWCGVLWCAVVCCGVCGVLCVVWCGVVKEVCRLSSTQLLEMTYESAQTRVFLQDYLCNLLLTSRNVFVKTKVCGGMCSEGQGRGC